MTSGRSSRSSLSSWRSVQSVEHVDDGILRWVVGAGDKQYAWTAEITEQRPDERVAWRAIEGRWNAGVVTFHRSR